MRGLQEFSKIDLDQNDCPGERNYINITLPHLDMCYTAGMSRKTHGASGRCHDAEISAFKVQ